MYPCAMSSPAVPPSAGHPSLIELFSAFAAVSLSGFGGALPWARRMIVERKRWMTAEEFNETFALSQFLPGPNVINFSVVFGARFGGATGAAVALAGLLGPPLVIVLVLAVLYARLGDIDTLSRILSGVTAAAVGLLVAVVAKMAAPMFLMYARVGRQTEAQSKPLSATVWFAAGYFLVWVAFALFATLVQWALERTHLLDFTMASTDNILGGLVFIAAGLYQWTRLNDLCLVQCQRPFEFVMSHGGYRRDAPGCIMLGLRHGAYCVGCCWALMALLLVGGVMNVLWIVLLALLAFLERVTSMGRLIARLAGIVLVAGGVWLFSMGMS